MYWLFAEYKGDVILNMQSAAYQRGLKTVYPVAPVFGTGLRVLLLCVLAILFSAGTAAFNQAEAETRTLRMFFTHTKEKADITFKKNGRYVKSGLRKANRFLRDWRRKEPTRMDPALLDLVWEVYQKSGSRKRIHVISGYRSPRTNKMLRRRGRGVARSSQHTRGKALDFFMPDVSVKKLRALGLQAHRGGVGFYRGSFVHMDTGRVRHWPRMSRRQLARVFPRGKTIHVPSNGKPLKGYKTAMANLKRGRNADGSSRRSAVRKTLLARIFRKSGDDGDENESNVTAKPKKAAPKVVKKAPVKKEKPKIEAPEKKEVPAPAVVVAEKPKGPDPFAQEAEVARKNSEKALQLAAADPSDLTPSRVTIPRRRPQIAEPQIAQAQIAQVATQIAQNDETPQQIDRRPLEPVGDTRVALALPQEGTSILRPRVEIPQAPPATKETSEEIARLNARIRTALASSTNLTPSQRAVEVLAEAKETVVASAQLKPTKPVARPTFPQQSTEEFVARLQPKRNPIEAVPAAVVTPPVLQASLQVPGNVPAPAWRIDETVVERAEEVLKSTKPVVVPLPKPNELTDREPSMVAVGYGEPIKPELRLGDLDGRSVKVWAVSSSTRVGALATLKAPSYKQGMRRPMPASVFSAGFNSGRTLLRADAFTGNSRTRVAFTRLALANF